eukprot:CAMPEP_0117071072 /NCGR_PEP_ID=MMETSP0472-20121206/49940_1 /TAXON_ID=693140 ORGANISM="Tiarina fusus, Strain LIS" /NCGR_SAMPLE_ID=MMETSP0472 /ASSEMBLY_ACC=CAM_ASM_000603 /LENGTH=98 /DNA_ID=CAMNT_0004794451 /DNA_START=23 /DNA_END=316 /DNA_ORIENTATION=+
MGNGNSSSIEYEPVIFSYKELEKKGIIVDSEIPFKLRKKTTITFSLEEGQSLKICTRILGYISETEEIEIEILGPDVNGKHLARYEFEIITVNVKPLW